MTRPDICSHCGQPIPPTGLRLPPIKQRIYEVVQRHPDISAEELRGLVWANDPNGDRKVLHVHVAQLNQLLAPLGLMVRSGGGYRIRSTA